MVSAGIENAAGNENTAVNNQLPDLTRKLTGDVAKAPADRAPKRRRASADDADVAQSAPSPGEPDTCTIKRRRIDTDAIRAKASAFLSSAAHGAVWASQNLKQQAFPAVWATLSHATATFAAAAARLQPTKTKAAMEVSAVKSEPAQATDPTDSNMPVEATVSEVLESFTLEAVNMEEVADPADAQAPIEATISDWERFMQEMVDTGDVAAPESAQASIEEFVEQEAATGAHGLQEFASEQEFVEQEAATGEQGLQGLAYEQGSESSSPWVMLYDPSSGRPYYWNQETNQVAWDLPH